MEHPFRFNILSFNWRLGILLIFLISIPRFIIVLDANRTGNYGFTSLIFVAMILIPFILLTKDGRTSVGLIKPGNFKWLALSFLMGVTLCTVIFWIGTTLFQYTVSNWFVYISESFSSIPRDQLTGSGKWTYFLIFALTGMTFSPLGEEFLYRGLIHRCFAGHYGDNRASMIDSAAFAVVHPAHFGIVYNNGEWEFLTGPALLWMGLMYISGRIFYICRFKTGSIFGAVASHAGFNLAMTWFIFFYIL